jgi:DnaJ family protein C protein 3
MVFYLIGLYFICRFEEGERDFRKILELKPGHSSAGKELAQTAEARDTLAEAELFIDTEEFTKAGEALDRVVSYSPECSQVKFCHLRICL